jgi:site-specific recombinase XerD
LAAVPLDSFDLDESLRNQARVFSALDEEVVETYVEAVKRGDEFPGVIAFKGPGRKATAKMLLADGIDDEDVVDDVHHSPRVRAGGRHNTTYDVLIGRPVQPALQRRQPLPHPLGSRPATLQIGSARTWCWQASQRAVEDFLGTGSFRHLTRVSYACDLASLTEYAATLGRPLLQLQRRDLEAFARMLTEQQGLAAATVNRRLSAVRGVYLRALQDGLLSTNPAAHLRGPRRDPAPPRLVLTPAQVQVLMAVAYARGDRSALLVSLLFQHGLRISEALGVTAEHIDADGVLLVHGKGGQRRLVPLTPPAHELSKRLAAEPGTTLLRTRTSRPLDRAGAARLLRRLAQQALPPDVATRISPHVGRRSMITAALRHGADHREIQLLVGHQDPATLLRYQQLLPVDQPLPTRLWHTVMPSNPAA